MKTLLTAHVTQLHNRSLPRLRRSVRAEAHVRAQIISLALVTPNNKQFRCFSHDTLRYIFRTLTLTLRTQIMTTVHTTQSQIFTPPLTKISVCVFLKNFNIIPIQLVGVLVYIKLRIDFWFELMYVVTRSEKELVHD